MQREEQDWPAGVGGLDESKPCPAMWVMPLARPPPVGHAAALRSGFSPSSQARPLLRGCPQVAWAQRELSGCLGRALFRVAKKGELVWTDRAMPTWAGEARDDRWAPEDGAKEHQLLDPCPQVQPEAARNAKEAAWFSW